MNDVTKSSCHPKPPICIGILCRVVAQFIWDNSSEVYIGRYSTKVSIVSAMLILVH